MANFIKINPELAFEGLTLEKLAENERGSLDEYLNKVVLPLQEDAATLVFIVLPVALGVSIEHVVLDLSDPGYVSRMFHSHRQFQMKPSHPSMQLSTTSMMTRWTSEAIPSLCSSNPDITIYYTL